MVFEKIIDGLDWTRITNIAQKMEDKMEDPGSRGGGRGGLGWFERSPFLMLAYAQKGKIKNLIKKHLSLLQSTLKCRKAMSEKLDFKLFRGRMHPNPLQIHTFGAPLTESQTRPTYGVVRRRGHSHGETWRSDMGTEFISDALGKTERRYGSLAWDPKVILCCCHNFSPSYWNGLRETTIWGLRWGGDF